MLITYYQYFLQCTFDKTLSPENTNAVIHSLYSQKKYIDAPLFYDNMPTTWYYFQEVHESSIAVLWHPREPVNMQHTQACIYTETYYLHTDCLCDIMRII